MRNPLAKLPRLFFENLEHRERENAMPEFIAHIRDDGTTQSVKDHLEGVAELAAGYARPFGGEKDAWQAGSIDHTKQHTGIYCCLCRTTYNISKCSRCNIYKKFSSAYKTQN